MRLLHANSLDSFSHFQNHWIAKKFFCCCCCCCIYCYCFAKKVLLLLLSIHPSFGAFLLGNSITFLSLNFVTHNLIKHKISPQLVPGSNPGHNRFYSKISFFISKHFDAKLGQSILSPNYTCDTSSKRFLF